MSKDDEQVWVFPACALQAGGISNGITRRKEDWEYFTGTILEKCTYMRRGDVEDAPSLQQVIPYVVCRQGSLVLLYNRGTKGGEKRLADKYSIGVGGHINLEDYHQEPVKTLNKAMSRELREELTTGGFLTNAPVLEFFGLLKADKTPVDEVHFGVVFQAEFTKINCIKETDEIEMHKWVTLEELKDYKLETWSEMVRDELLKGE